METSRGWTSCILDTDKNHSLIRETNIRIFLISLGFLVLTGCASIPTPYKDLNLDTTSNLSIPKEGKSGIYVYQWKCCFWTGPYGAVIDAEFEIKGEPKFGYKKISLNTGEYGYFEVEPGQYEYRAFALPTRYIPVELEANENYFFQVMAPMTSVPFFLMIPMPSSFIAVLIRDQPEIDRTKENISTGHYEINSED